MKYMKNHSPIVIYSLVWLICIIAFWISGDDCGLGYGLLVFYAILPFITFVASYFYGRRESKWKWFVTAFFGFMEVMACWFTFDLANMIAFNHWNMPNWGMAVGIMMLSAVGLILGHVRGKKNTK